MTTQNQEKLIDRLRLEKLGAEKEISDFLEKKKARTISELSTQEASELIDTLIRLPNREETKKKMMDAMKVAQRKEIPKPSEARVFICFLDQKRVCAKDCIAFQENVGGCLILEWIERAISRQRLG